ncbi:sensor histidine kinase [Sphingobacterium lactis]|uniref:sensor histidine kinase n=1 Tax=Sphingobacterium TaxID=28453 RepID=UPI0021A65E36|nr:histidine kinase [Sphingobacterium hotanense]MCT1525803.1 histidine kinase [Sphingobacterium hotanense]
MAQLAKVFNNYTPTKRIIAHVLFWSSMFAIFIVLYNRYDKEYAWLLALKDLVAVTVIFYTTSYIIIPKWLMQNKFVLSLAWLLIIYLWWAALTYLVFLGIDVYIDQMSPNLRLVVDTVLKMGILGPIKPATISMYILDFVYLISLPVGIKLIEAMLNVRNQKTELELKNAELALSNTELALNNTELELNNVQLELAFLKSQINPHFLFNALNNILILMGKDVNKAIDSQRHLTGILGYLVYDSNRSTVTLEEEYTFLRNYVELERIRLDPEISIKVSMEADYSNYKVVPLILFPFLENAFKHGPMASGKGSNMRIIIYVKGNVLTMDISNSYIKLDKPVGYKGGVGIENVRRRLELNYPDNHQLVISNDNGRYSVLLTIQLEQANPLFRKQVSNL